jgi:sigma-B regulation protein RsbU (phosphoserine phosphatase)
MSSVLTTDFRHEYEQEQTSWLRRRFLWYSGSMVIFRAVMLLATVLLPLAVDFSASTPDGRKVYAGPSPWATVLGAMSLLIGIVLYSRAYLQVHKRPEPRARLLHRAFALLVITGVLSVVIGFASSLLAVEDMPKINRVKELMQQYWFWSYAGGMFFGLCVTHFVACLFLPWTPREATRPVLPIWAAFSLAALFAAICSRAAWLVPGGSVSGWVVAFWLVIFPSLALPGLGVSWWRNSRFREKFLLDRLSGSYSQMKRELTNARAIHESLFPKPTTCGALRFDYRYEPFRLIGGDYLHARFESHEPGDPNPALNFLLLDVTGHGVPAALTVNRLYGEVERLFAENPNIRPAQVLSALNKYVHLTLANHSVFVTALAARICSKQGTMEYCNAGHPPALLRSVDGKIESLDSTAMVLGVCPHGEYETETMHRKFGPGDVLIAYTDGAMETRNAHGRMLGCEGIERMLATHNPRSGVPWAEALLTGVSGFRFGPPADDTLIVEVVRDLSGVTSSSASEARRDEVVKV